MSGFKPNMWKFKKQNPPPSLPTTNAFWKDVVDDDEKEKSESKEDDNKTEESNPEKPNGESTKKCFSCGGFDHLIKDCPSPLSDSSQNTSKTSKTKKCYRCQTTGHVKAYCPLRAVKAETSNVTLVSSSVKSEKPNKPLLNLSVKKTGKNITWIKDGNCSTCHGCHKNCPKRQPSCTLATRTKIHLLNKQKSQTETNAQTAEQAKSNNQGSSKCAYCGVVGHLIEACPVKRWSVGPGGSESDAALKEDFASHIDGKQPEPENPTLVAAGAPGKVSGKPIETLSRAQINKAIKKKEKEIKKAKALLAQAESVQTQLATLGPKVKTPGYVMHPTANVKTPLKPQVPLAPPQLVVPNMPQNNHRQTYPSGIPKSFLMQQMPQQNSNMGNTTPQPKTTQPSFQQFSWPQAPQPAPLAQTFVPTDQSSPLTFVPIQKDEPMDEPRQAYSPSDVYGDMKNESGSTEAREGSESPDSQAQKRLSAFQRLGPATQKKPKLTINLSCNKGEAVREVVDETTEYVEEHTPVHLRSDVTTSTDETVMKYLYFWPWRKPVGIRRTAAFKNSKSAMLLEQEQMEESYDKDNLFIQITVTNYPRTWTKEVLFDVLLEQVSFIPCFVEFTSKECKFLVVRSKSALLSIHKMGFRIRKEDVELVLTISITSLTLNQIDFLPRLVLRKRLGMGYDGEGCLNLKEFTLQSDVSHFIYFPLNRLSNQTDLVQLQSVVDWERLTELDLSHNRLSTIDGFNLTSTCPHLERLDISHNNIDKVSAFIHCRNLPIRSIYLEGNPLCHHYTNPDDYVRIVRMLFPTVRKIDGINLHFKGELPSHRKNYCFHGSEGLVGKYLDIYYPLLEAQPSDRQLIEDMYDENAVMTTRYRYKFIHRLFRVASSSTKFDDGIKDVVEGATSITKYINKWPVLKHDPFSFTVDVMFHSKETTIVKICGILKLTAESLAEDEHVVSFSRTVLLRSSDGIEYKIHNELLLWDEPSSECHATAFSITKIRSKKLYVDLEFDPSPDEETKEKLIIIFEHLTELDRQSSRKCLERKDWNLKSALDNFIQLLKLNDLSSINAIPIPVDQQGRKRQLLPIPY